MTVLPASRFAHPRQPVTSPEPPTVLLLHGQPGTGADWDRVVTSLDGRAEVVVLDRPGYDGTSAADLPGNARAALAALDDRRSSRAVVAGHRLGAAVAAWLAATHPDRVAALVLAAPAANLAALCRSDRWLAAPVAGELAAGMGLGGLGAALAVGSLRRRIADATGLQESYLQRAGRAARRPSTWSTYAAEQRTLVRELPELQRRLGRITAPTTIIAGARDRVVPAHATRRLREQIPGARLQISRSAGHLVPQRDPDTVVGAILAALDR
jgi:3-oxoadipate enol-lactonase / 4-carboxymuconolactone decarboxylase